MCGAVQLREDVKRFTSNGVEFKDGTYQDIDIVVLCTGYIIGFPFVDKEVMMGTMMMMIILLVMLLSSWEQRAMKRIVRRAIEKRQRRKCPTVDNSTVFYYCRHCQKPCRSRIGCFSNERRCVPLNPFSAADSCC